MTTLVDDLVNVRMDLLLGPQLYFRNLVCYTTTGHTERHQRVIWVFLFPRRRHRCAVWLPPATESSGKQLIACNG